MKLSPAVRYTMEATFEDVVGVLRKVSYKFSRKYQVEQEECFSEACFLFTEAYLRYLPEKGEFEPYLVYYVWHRMLSEVKKRLSRRLQKVEKDLEEFGRRQSAFDLEEFLEELSDDAATVVAVLTDVPDEVAEQVIGRGVQSPYLVKQAVARYLKEGAGWTARRVAESFREVSEALKRF